MTSPALGMLFGFVNTATLHLAKGLQRQGIETLRWRSTPRHERSGKKAAIYIVGVTLNNLSALWLILANRFAAPAYATGMFGLGLVVLMLYSHVVLHEAVSPVNYLGSALIVVGTALYAIHAANFDELDVSLMSARAVGLFSGTYVLSAALIAALALRRGTKEALSVAFGLFAGGLASLDPVLKGVGQYAGGEASVFPTVAWGWVPFLVSFAFAIVAFVSVQFAFHRGAIASAMIPVQSSVYILLPVLVQLVALPGYEASVLLVSGCGLILCGIVLTQQRRRASPEAPE